MKLVHPDLQMQLHLTPPAAVALTIEAPELFLKYIQDLYLQSNGREGQFVLSDVNKELRISKFVEVILEPFSLDTNDRRILNKVYADLRDLAMDEEGYLRTQDILAQLQQYFMELEERSPYILTVDSDINVIDVFKALGVRFEAYEEGVFENLTQYIRILGDVLQKKVVVLVGMTGYLTKEQIMLLTKEAIYHEISIIYAESKSYDWAGLGIVSYIIDSDGCEIF